MNSDIPHQDADYKTYLENVSLENSEISLHKYLLYGKLNWKLSLHNCPRLKLIYAPT